jgi:hypothetical protein
MIIAMEERGDAHEKLEQEDTKGPPVNCVVMAIPDDHLRGEVLRRPAEGVGLVFLALSHLGEAEVSQLQVPILIEEDVLWLQVPVQNVLLVEMSKCQSDLRYHEACFLL